MADSIPEELCSFGVTSKDFDEKKGVLTKTMGTEVDEKEVFFSLFQDLATKAINYQILQMLYWNLARVNPDDIKSLQVAKGTLETFLKK